MSSTVGPDRTTRTEDITPSTVLGLPVDTFAYILVGIGVGGAVLFVVVYCLAKYYCKSCWCREAHSRSPKRSNFKSVRELWEHDTMKRKRDLEAAGYSNEAFDNMEELSVLSFHKGAVRRSSETIRSEPASFSHKHSNGIGDKGKVKSSKSTGNLYKKKKSAVPVKLSKSSPPSLPQLLVNGEAVKSSDFDQLPRKLGSSLVRIDEEVIVEEELDIQKNKSKKKSKGSKKGLLSPQLSSDGLGAEEPVDVVVADVPGVVPTGCLLMSEVVVHVDNVVRHDGETGEQLNDAALNTETQAVSPEHSVTNKVSAKENSALISTTMSPELGTELAKSGNNLNVAVDKSFGEGDNNGTTDSTNLNTETVPGEVDVTQTAEDIVTIKTDKLNCVAVNETGEHVNMGRDTVTLVPNGHVQNVLSDKTVLSGQKTSHREANIFGNFNKHNPSVFGDNNNSIHYTKGVRSGNSVKKMNGVYQNGRVNGLNVSKKNSENAIIENGGPLTKGYGSSEPDSLGSWLHDVYVSRSDGAT